jgi:putative ABC transport system permease protein
MASIIVLLGLVLLLVAALTAALALRYRVPFRIAMRNARRGRWRSVLIVLGLLVGTAIISGSLVINDTVAAVNVHFVYQSYGFTDEAVYNDSVAQGSAPYLFFPFSVYSAIANQSATEPLIAGVTPEIVDSGSVYDLTSGVPETGVQVVGVNATASGPLGPFTYDNGSTTAGPAPGEVLLDDQLASNLGASAGDRVVLHGATAVPLVVQGIVRDDTRGGFLGGNNAFVTLPTAQAFANASGQLNFIAVTNVDSLTAGVAHTNAVMSFLNSTLASLGHPNGLVAVALLQTSLNQAIASGQSIATLFLVLGLFSIVAGALLIVGIFVTLAEERKGEMGMLRAVGLTRRGLVYTYFFEGTVYAALSALAGTALGVLVGYVLVLTYSQTLALTSASVATAFVQSFTVSTQSLVTAYVLGFLLTVVTIAATSARVSRLNIVRAIRSVPEPPPARRVYTYLAYVGVLLAAVGGLLFATTRAGTGDVSVPLLGFGLVIVGAGFVGARFVPDRYAFSAVGVMLIAWGGTVAFHRALLGNGHSGTIFAVFIEGIEMVLGAVLLFVFNSDLIIAGITRLAGRRGTRVPVVRVGLAYPRRRPMRSAVNFTIFAMVIFTVVVVAAYGDGVSTAVVNSETAESGGYTLFGYSTSSIPDLPGQVANNSTLASVISLAIPVAYGTVVTYPAGWSGAWYDSIYAPPSGGPPSQSFYTTNRYNFTATWHGMSAAAVWSDVQTNATVAVVDGAYAPGPTSIDASPHPTVALGASVLLANPTTGNRTNVTVIGYMDQTFLSGFWVNPGTAARLGYTNLQGSLYTVAAGVSATTAAQDLKRAFFPYGLEVFNFAEILQHAVQTLQGVIGLLEIFVALGLAVGIAGMGIVALRAVTERRTQIGMLRAEGFTRGMILTSFLIEYSYITLFGTGVGTALAIWLYYNATAANPGGQFGTFVVPVVTVVSIVLLAYLLTVAAIAGPSWKAATLPPAEAVRYTE